MKARSYNMLNNGDKLVVVKTVTNFLKEGDLAEVVGVNENGVISFAFGENSEHMGMMTHSEFEEHFKKIEDVKMAAPRVTEEHVAEIMEQSEFEVHTAFDKCTIVSCRLPNGFVIVEYSSCVSPENYDEELGTEICFDRIAGKICELEAYRLQQELYERDYNCCCENCGGCACEECEEEFDECLDTDLDCDDCEDFECPYNSNLNNPNLNY